MAETINTDQLSGRQLGLGITVAVTTIIAGALLQYTRRILGVPTYLKSNFIKLRSSPILAKLATILYYIILFIPVILLLVWVILLGAAHGTTPTLPVLFTFIFVIVLVVPTARKWFYIKVLVAFITFIVTLLVTMGLFWSDSSPSSFFCLTSVLLILNGIFISCSLWILDGCSWNLSSSLTPIIKTQIISQVDIWNEEQQQIPEIISGGLYSMICSSSIQRYIIIVVMYVLGLLTLMTYALVTFYHTSFGFQGVINSVCILTTDIIIAQLIFITKETNFNPITNSIVGILVRITIIALSNDLWFLAYCLLYLVLMTYISLLVINQYYPTYEKMPVLEIVRVNILKKPLSCAFLLLIMFSALIYFIGTEDGSRIPVLSITLDGNVYSFWVIGICSVLLSMILSIYLISLRIIDRSHAQIRTMQFYYMGMSFCSEYYLFLSSSYLLLVVLGFYLWSNSKVHLIWASCVFLPIFYEAFVIFYTNWQQNDYEIFGSVKKYNSKIDKKREKMRKITEMKQSLNKMMKLEELDAQNSKINLMQGADVQSNFMLEDIDAKKKEDWRKKYSALQAFKENALLPSDRKIIICLILMLTVLISYSVMLLFISNTMIGFTISVQLLFFLFSLIPLKKYFATLERPSIIQIIIFITGIALNYAYGVLSLVFKWHDSILWTVWWALINISILSLYCTFAFLRDKGIVIASLICSIISTLFILGIGILLIIGFNIISVGVIMIAVALYYAYVIGLYFLYLYGNKSLPWLIYPITGGLIIATSFAVMIYGFVDSFFDNFYGFSITYLVINFLVLLYALYLLFEDYQNRFDRPNFYSPYGTPVFKYDSTIESVRDNSRSLMIWLIAWFMFYFYTLLMEIFIRDTNYGISAGCLFLVIMFLTLIYFTTYNSYKAGKLGSRLTDKIIADSWNQLKQMKKKSLNVINVNSLKQKLFQYEKQRDSGLTMSKLKVHPSNENNLEVNEVDIDIIIYDLQNKLQYAIEDQEILLVNFWMRIMFKCETARKKQMIQFKNFIRDQGDQLTNLGIAIILDDDLYDLESVYNKARQQYNILSPIQKIKFDRRFKDYLQHKKQNQQKDEENNRKELQAQKKREEDLRKKLEAGDKDDSNLPIEQMNDSPIKLKKIAENSSSLYVDSSFKANAGSVPENSISQLKGWVRPDSNSVLIDEHSAMSVKQGYIGDCFLISAIGVLDKKSLRSILGLENNLWQNPKGAYMVKFRKYGKDIYIIVDDQFPVDDGQSWLFGQCENPKEIFTNVLEKAYAKLYGSYKNIVGGKVSIALADMTGGFPQQIMLKKYQQSNTNQIFEKMTQFKKLGYLMGAGSPPNAQGDAVDIDGIVQGHAYLVLDVRNLDGNKIIKLRNPHGNQGRQSTLDWSDNSSKWTKRLLNLIGEEMKEDGAFWMSLQDFVYCYRALYVCRIFDTSKWKRIGPIAGKWSGKSAAGLPSRKNPTVLIADNPHYGIKVTRKSILFLQLTQNETNQNRQAKNYIFFMAQKNNGKRITTNSVNKLAGNSGTPINSRTISSQIDLNAPSYPYTFSLMISAYEPGAQGSYQLMMFCDDPNIQVVLQDQFDI